MKVERYRLMFQYEAWANRRVFESLKAAKQRGEGVKLLAHILAAQEVWLARLWRQDSSSVSVWPELGLDEIELKMERLNGEIEAYLETLDGETLTQEIAYRTQAGREYRNTPLDILTHLGMHSQHHRGQIALELRRLGEQPAVTDFIVFRRP